MKANDHQVGGTHYKTAYEHWDWAFDVGLGYLAGCATKYVSRWRKKGGLDDLKKALHYVNKMLETKWEYDKPALGYHNMPVVDGDKLKTYNAAFVACNQLGPLETRFCELLACWGVHEDLIEAREVLLKLLEIADPEKPVSLEDSNKHADRE